MSRGAQFLGIDVGARTLHCASIDEQAVSVDRAALPAEDTEALAHWCADAEAGAIDAPEAPSTAPHAEETGLSPKFRRARCAEIELGRRHGSWVSWVAPVEAPFSPWMEAGFRAFATLRAAGAPELLEVYPYAGRKERVRLLAAAGVAVDRFATFSHDFLDATVAALTALDRARGRARPVTCGHDASAIWLPADGPVRQ